MKRLILLSLTLTVLLAGYVVPTASAHVLKTDGNIGAILHINPDDNPISGSPTQYILYFDDVTNQFSLNHCSCRVTIQENGQTIANHIIEVTNPTESVNSYIFPKPDVYTLEVSGQPNAGYKFQAFTLNYLVRVESNGVSAQPIPLLLWVGVGLMMGLILLAAFAMELDS